MTAITVAPHELPLPCLYRWERECADRVYLSQPMGGGVVQDSTTDGEWEEALWKAAYVQGLVRRT